MGEIRGELLKELLEKRVTYSDIKKHKLNEEELKYLYLVDSIDCQEYVYAYRHNHPYSHPKSAYNQWNREREKVIHFLLRPEGAVEYNEMSQLCMQYGVDLKIVDFAFRKAIPVSHHYVSHKIYVMDLLQCRETMYNRFMTVEEAANFLGISANHFRKISRQVDLEILKGRVRIYDLANYLWSKISNECNLLMKISPERLKNFVDGREVEKT